MLEGAVLPPGDHPEDSNRRITSGPLTASRTSSRHTLLPDPARQHKHDSAHNQNPAYGYQTREEKHLEERANALAARLYTVAGKGQVPKFDVKRVKIRGGMGMSGNTMHMKRPGSGERLVPLGLGEAGVSVLIFVRL